jgi:hypothetical protein
MTLALSNLVLASTQFAEPVLSGKVIDTLSIALDRCDNERPLESAMAT